MIPKKATACQLGSQGPEWVRNLGPGPAAARGWGHEGLTQMHWPVRVFAKMTRFRLLRGPPIESIPAGDEETILLPVGPDNLEEDGKTGHPPHALKSEVHMPSLWLRHRPEGQATRRNIQATPV